MAGGGPVRTENQGTGTCESPKPGIGTREDGLRCGCSRTRHSGRGHHVEHPRSPQLKQLGCPLRVAGRGDHGGLFAERALLELLGLPRTVEKTIGSEVPTEGR